jgi:hypothetical protein
MEVGGDRGLCIFQRVWSRNQEPEPRTVELGPIHNVLGKKSSQGWVKWSEHSASPSKFAALLGLKETGPNCNSHEVEKVKKGGPKKEKTVEGGKCFNFAGGEVKGTLVPHLLHTQGHQRS